MERLDQYIAKRDFTRTPEPAGGVRPEGLAPRYSMQKHDATRLHWDLRLEWDGVLLSWAVTAGPSFDTGTKRLAVRTEDHPLDYLDFEGIIPKDNYGAGNVMLWDLGHWQPVDPVEKGLKKGHLHFRLHGLRMTGGWHLVRMKGKGEKRENWLLIKEDDDAAGKADPVRRYTRSVSTRRTMREIASEKPEVEQVWPGTSPRFRKPQLAQLTDTLTTDDDRWHELKFDGYRALVSLGKSGARVFTRNGHDWSDRFASLLPGFDEIECEDALLDGEIVAGAGLSGFGTLQKAIKAGGPFTFYAFDLLTLDGKDIAAKPLNKRREALEKLISKVPPLGHVQLSPVIEGDASESFDAICGAGGEGLISKRISAPYRSGRSSVWQKIKCQRREDFVIVGYQPSSAKGRPFASLLLADRDGSDLTYVGKVGTGFDGATMEAVMSALKPHARKTAPLEAPKKDTKGARWVTPKLLAEITYAEQTGDGLLRHAVFEGLREDIMVDTESSDSDDPVVAGIAISSGNRKVFPEAEKTKLDVARYYEAMADEVLKETADRPLSLVRLPTGLEGERFFQKHAGKGFPKALKQVEIEESDGETAAYMYVSDAAGLVAAAQMGTIEFHIWGSRRDRLERPDRMVFDLDPDEDLGFADVKRAAVNVRDRLSHLGLESWAMVTGGKGVHVVVPLRRTANWDTVKLFARTFATLLSSAEPKRYLSEASKAKRKGRIFIDWLRNERGATAVAPFSLRARTGAPVAVPVSWDELGKLRAANPFKLDDALKRSWGDLELPDLQTLGAKVIDRLEVEIGKLS